MNYLHINYKSRKYFNSIFDTYQNTFKIKFNSFATENQDGNDYSHCQRKKQSELPELICHLQRKYVLNNKINYLQALLIEHSLRLPVPPLLLEPLPSIHKLGVDSSDVSGKGGTCHLPQQAGLMDTMLGAELKCYNIR